MSIKFKNVSFYYDDPGKPIFEKLSLELPTGVISLIGQNGTGKSTFMLLAGGRLLPQTGDVFINGDNTKEILSESKRNHLASFIYQNMEFETEQTIGELFKIVFVNGAHDSSKTNLLDELITEFELEKIVNRNFHQTSKGEMQKINIVFSLLYGSPIIFMDEPIFSLEDHWKDRVLNYLRNYAHKHGVTLYYSIHELDLSRKYSDMGILFFKNGQISYGPADKLLSKENVEEAYQVPMELLYKREQLFRNHLLHPMETDDLNNMDHSVKVFE